MVAVQAVNVTLPQVPGGWSAEKDFKSAGAVSGATQRKLEPVGPYFLAHARRVCLLLYLYDFIYSLKGANNPLEASPSHFLRG